MEQLNGWQRTWLVLTVLWVASMALFALSTWPNDIDVPLTYIDVPLTQTDHARLVGSLLSNAPLTPAERRAASDAYTSSANEDELQEKLVALKLPRAVMADLWDLKYAQRQQKAQPTPTAQPRATEDWLSGIRFSILLFVFGSAIPSLGLYSMGLAIAWIVRGFRRG